MRSMRLRSRYMRLFQRILALRLDLGGIQERMPASCRLARMIGDWYLPNSRMRCKQYEKARNDQGRIPFSADRREDQGTGRLEGRDALPCPRSHQTGCPPSGRGVEVERRSGLVSRWNNLHRRDLQERREADVRQGRFAQGPFRTIQLQP